MEEFDDYIFLIPARKGSKGVPFKNRKLFDYTAKIIPDSIKHKVYVSTDDEFFIEKCKEFGFNYIERDPLFAQDETTTKDMVNNFIDNNKIVNKTIILLYLTYPERKWIDVLGAKKFYELKKCQSLLCKKKTIVSPYLILYDLGDDFGEQVIPHNLCRRQEYRECFEISHFISIFSVQNLKDLNVNLYNSKTKFMIIKNAIDIDTTNDLRVFYDKSKNNSRDRD